MDGSNQSATQCGGLPGGILGGGRAAGGGLGAKMYTCARQGHAGQRCWRAATAQGRVALILQRPTHHIVARVAEQDVPIWRDDDLGQRGVPACQWQVAVLGVDSSFSWAGALASSAGRLLRARRTFVGPLRLVVMAGLPEPPVPAVPVPAIVEIMPVTASTRLGWAHREVIYGRLAAAGCALPALIITSAPARPHLITLLPVSAMKRFPAASKAMPCGALSVADVAFPPSPV
jgi:hypothetical protein